jgi:hypothetical protein
MSGHTDLYKLAVASAIAATLLFPLRGYASDVQIFPPQTVAGLTCPQGNSLALTWDGTHNVECSNIPTCNTALGQGLTFDGSNFSCITPCVPQATTIDTGTCPPGEIGAPVSQPAVLNCDGTITPTSASPTNTCQVFVAAIGSVPCTPGQTLTGFIDANGNYNVACGGANPACVNYTCTANGLVPQ